MNIEDRLRELRNSKQLNQEGFAALAGVSKTTQNNYETGKRKPTFDYLESLAAAGLDVAYLLTGRRDPKLLTEDQRRLVDMFSGLNEERQRALMATATDLYIKESKDSPRAGQRMRVRPENTVNERFQPTSETVHESRAKYGNKTDSDQD